MVFCRLPPVLTFSRTLAWRKGKKIELKYKRFGIDWTTLNDAQRASDSALPAQSRGYHRAKGEAKASGVGGAGALTRVSGRKKAISRNLVMMSDLTLFHVKLTFIATRWYKHIRTVKSVANAKSMNEIKNNRPVMMRRRARKRLRKSVCMRRQHL